MLTEFLSKTRTARKAKGNADTKIDVVIDTTLAKLLADADLTDELMTMLAAPNSVALSELEPFLANKSVLLTVMRRQGRTDRVLELLKE
jgi:hypothetical protein